MWKGLLWWFSLLRLHAPNTRGPGSIPAQGTRSHLLQVTDPMWGNQDLLQPYEEVNIKKKKKTMWKLLEKPQKQTLLSIEKYWENEAARAKQTWVQIPLLTPREIIVGNNNTHHERVLSSSNILHKACVLMVSTQLMVTLRFWQNF